MSYLTDRARAASPSLSAHNESPASGETFEEVVARSPVTRRMVLRGGLGASLSAVFGSAVLSACSDDETVLHAFPGGDAGPDGNVGPGVDAGSDTGVDAGPNYAVQFKPIARNVLDQVTVPEGYSVDVMFSAGDAVVAGAVAYSGTFLTSAETEKIAGGGHDGMKLFELPGVDPNKGGLLAVNHEAPDFQILMKEKYDGKTATPEQKKIVLSSVGVSILEIELKGDGKWGIKAGSRYNKRYSGNTVYKVRGPAASLVGATVVGTLNNCSSGMTPWGTYLTCEETMKNDWDPTQPVNGYGWVVEIDPRGELADMPVKRTALGRFDHENSAYLLAADNSLAFYIGDDGTPGCIYKFVPSGKFDPQNRAANANLLDTGTLYAAKFNADGTGQWIELVQGKNGLLPGATDPGNETQGPDDDETVNFATQADVLINTKSAARVAGATLMDRPEWITVAPDKSIYCTLTNNSGRAVTDKANPRTKNLHGHIIKWRETGDSPVATTFTWEVFLLAGDPSLTSAGLAGNIDGDTFSSPDGIHVDPQGRLWVETDMGVRDTDNAGVEGKSNVAVFGNNSMYNVDPTTKKSKRFLVGPTGCEITGITHTPDLRTFFVNIQHPSGTWPSSVQGNSLPPRSSTIVIRRTDGQPVGA